MTILCICRMQVVYACLHNIDDSVNRLRQMADILDDRCREAGLHRADTYGFSPHITLFKLIKNQQLYRKVLTNRPQLLPKALQSFNKNLFHPHSQGVRSIPQHLYAEHMELPFGKQVFFLNIKKSENRQTITICYQ